MAVLRKYDYVACRTFGHAWKLNYVHRPEWAPSMRIMVLECLTCRMTRTDTVSPEGHVRERKYDQPEGYKITGERTPRDNFRAEVMRRAGVRVLTKKEQAA